MQLNTKQLPWFCRIWLVETLTKKDDKYACFLSSWLNLLSKPKTTDHKHMSDLLPEFCYDSYVVIYGMTL